MTHLSSASTSGWEWSTVIHNQFNIVTCRCLRQCLLSAWWLHQHSSHFFLNKKRTYKHEIIKRSFLFINVSGPMLPVALNLQNLSSAPRCIIIRQCLVENGAHLEDRSRLSLRVIVYPCEMVKIPFHAGVLVASSRESEPWQTHMTLVVSMEFVQWKTHLVQPSMLCISPTSLLRLFSSTMVAINSSVSSAPALEDVFISLLITDRLLSANLLVIQDSINVSDNALLRSSLNCF